MLLAFFTTCSMSFIKMRQVLNLKVSFSSFFFNDSLTSLSLKLDMSFLKVYSYMSFAIFLACSHLGWNFSIKALGIFWASRSREYFHFPILDIIISLIFFCSYVVLDSYFSILKFTMHDPDSINFILSSKVGGGFLKINLLLLCQFSS